ncbi:hypothetical protein HOY80DRAFT_1137928 [Tuber brumale]|nr:hypothetical protein HOY80DRAFT_1137928 [Tuber brumale]
MASSPRPEMVFSGSFAGHVLPPPRRRAPLELENSAHYRSVVLNHHIGVVVVVVVVNLQGASSASGTQDFVVYGQ